MDEFRATNLIASTAPSVGHCNTMGTALVMNVLAETLGMSLPGCASVSVHYWDRHEMTYNTGSRIVEMVREVLRPSHIMIREAFLNTIVATSAIGASSNAPVHINTIAHHMGAEVSLGDCESVGKHILLLVNLQPRGDHLVEGFYWTGVLPALVGELISKDAIKSEHLTVSGHTIRENYASVRIDDIDVIRPRDNPLEEDAGFIAMSGNIFASAVMKVSVTSAEFRNTYLSDPEHSNDFWVRAIAFDGSADYHARINDLALNLNTDCILVMWGSGSIGSLSSAEVVNMQSPDDVIHGTLRKLRCLGDGRQSGISGSPFILNASPDSASSGGLAIIETSDTIHVDLNNGSVNQFVLGEVRAARLEKLDRSGGYPIPAHSPPGRRCTGAPPSSWATA